MRIKWGNTSKYPVLTIAIIGHCLGWISPSFLILLFLALDFLGLFCFRPGICLVDFGQFSFSGFDPGWCSQGHCLCIFSGPSCSGNHPFQLPSRIAYLGSAPLDWTLFAQGCVCVCVGGERKGLRWKENEPQTAHLTISPFIQWVASWNVLWQFSFHCIIFLYIGVYIYNSKVCESVRP